MICFKEIPLVKISAVTWFPFLLNRRHHLLAIVSPDSICVSRTDCAGHKGNQYLIRLDQVQAYNRRDPEELKWLVERVMVPGHAHVRLEAWMLPQSQDHRTELDRFRAGTEDDGDFSHAVSKTTGLSG